jgi:hypothetical protein
MANYGSGSVELHQIARLNSKAYAGESLALGSHREEKTPPAWEMRRISDSRLDRRPDAA